MRFSLVALLLTVAACSSRTDSQEDTNEGAARITPHGTDSPAKVVVVLPDGAPAIVDARVTVDQNPTKFKLGEPIPVGIGNHDVTVTSEGAAKIASTVSISAKAGQQITLHASVLVPDATKAPRTFGLGGDVKLSGPATELVGADANGKNAFAAVGPVYFRFGLGRLDGTAFDVPSPLGDGAGVVVNADVADAKQRRRAAIRAPSSRDFPDVQCNGEPVMWSLKSEATTDRATIVPLPPGQAIEIGLAPWQPNVTYRFGSTVLDDIAGVVDVPLGTAGGTANAFGVGRIDVGDVELPDGTTVKGTFEIRRNATATSTQSSNLLLCRAETGHGVDVPPGDYEVRTTYRTTEAGEKTDIQNVTVP